VINSSFILVGIKLLVLKFFGLEEQHFKFLKVFRSFLIIREKQQWCFENPDSWFITGIIQKKFYLFVLAVLNSFFLPKGGALDNWIFVMVFWFRF